MCFEDDTEGLLGPIAVEYARELSAQSGRNVTVYFENAPPVDRAKEDNYSDLMTRQRERVDRLIKQANKDGVAWTLHGDDDELFYPGSAATGISTWPKVLAAVPSSCASVHMQNWEGFSPSQPKSSWLTDDGIRYLPQSCGHLYAAYGNGKSASRTTPGQSSHGPHHFKGGKECELPEDAGVVLHHEALALGSGDVPPERWVEKNRLRLNDDMSKIPFVATHDAVEAVRSGDAARMAATWQKYRSVDGERFKSCPNPMALQLPSHAYLRGPSPGNV